MVAEVSDDFNHEVGLGAYLDMSPAVVNGSL